MLLLSAITQMVQKKRSGVFEILTAIVIVVVVLMRSMIFGSSVAGHYLLCAVVVAEIARFLACGFWFFVDFHPAAHYWCPQKDELYKVGTIIKLTAYFFSILFAYMATLAHHSAWQIDVQWQVIPWLIITTATFYELARTIILVAQKWNPKWLKMPKEIAEIPAKERSTIREIGACCYLALWRLGLAIFAPFCLLLVPTCGFPIAAGAGIAIIVELALNSFFYLSDEKAHKAFCWLDTFIVKYLFASNSIALCYIVWKSDVKINGNNGTSILMFFCVAIIIIKDIITAIWHLTGRYDITSFLQEDGHFAISTARSLVAYVWLIASTATMTFGFMYWGHVAIIGAVIVAVLSLITIFVENEDIVESKRSYYYY